MGINPQSGVVYDGIWLRQRRQANGLYVHQLAAKLDINPGRISEWENGRKPIPDHRITQIRQMLN